MAIIDQFVNTEPTTDSPYYPFRKVVEANTLAGVEQLPYVLTRYLMDLPSRGYTPPSDNRYPRARLKKLIYWDSPLPLNQPLPTTQQMKSIQFDPMNPSDPPDKDRGYRIFSQELVQQAQANAQSIIRCYLGEVNRQLSQKNEFVFRQQIIIQVMVNYALESNTKMTYASRSAAMMQAIVEACEGVNFGGIGGFTTTRISKFDDERVNTGYKIYGYIDWNGSAPNQFFTE